MRMARFRDYKIQRSCQHEYKDYHSYLKPLIADFSNRCCYCNIRGDILGTASFQIDHYVPQKSFGGKRDELLTEYDNLILACPKCNRAKSDQFSGDVMSSPLENKLFYNPDKKDYDEIFYRDELGMIASDDEKGREMIQRLKLYRPIHSYSWALEKLDDIIKILGAQTATGSNEKLKNEQGQLALEYIKIQKQFIAAYHGK